VIGIRAQSLSMRLSCFIFLGTLLARFSHGFQLKLPCQLGPGLATRREASVCRLWGAVSCADSPEVDSAQGPLWSSDPAPRILWSADLAEFIWSHPERLPNSLDWPLIHLKNALDQRSPCRPVPTAVLTPPHDTLPYLLDTLSNSLGLHC